MVRCVAKVKWLVQAGQATAAIAIGAAWLSGSSALASNTHPAAIIHQQIDPQLDQQQSLNAGTNDRLPPEIAQQVRRDLAGRLDVPVENLSVVSYSQQTWSDSCLGLGTAVELCAQALVPGWQVELTDGEQRWVYRTDETGQTMRLEAPAAPDDSVSLPDEVGDRILQAAAAEANVPEATLTIVAAQPKTWDGCLGIAAVDGACTQIAISGWQAIVAGESGSWVYHSNEDGSDVRLNETASLPEGTVALNFISSDQVPGDTETGVVFKAIVEGGITGSSSQILLLEDGQVVQFADDQGVSTATELNQLSPEQVQAFTEVLRQQLFSNLNGLNYAAPSGAADYRTVTLIGQGSTVQYADIVQDQLPSTLQQVIQVWEETISD